MSTARGIVYGCDNPACGYRWEPTTLAPAWKPDRCPLCRVGKWQMNPPPARKAATPAIAAKKGRAL